MATQRIRKTKLMRSVEETHGRQLESLVPDLVKALEAEGARDVLVVCGGVIPAQDYDFLAAAGVAGVYGPGTNIPAAAREILDKIRASRAPGRATA